MRSFDWFVVVSPSSPQPLARTVFEQDEYFNCSVLTDDDVCCHAVASSLTLSYRSVSYVTLVQSLMALVGAFYLAYRLLRRSRLFGHASLRMRNRHYKENNNRN